jgi:dolichyl-phosphate beta-glucosyltransferase
MPQRRCSFVIPAYNEARRLPATLAAIARLSASHLGKCEIIIADDGSTDSTADIATNFHDPMCQVRVIRLAHRGKGHAIRRGVSFANGEIVILSDADLHESVGEVLCLEQALRRGAEIAIGSRWLDHFDFLRAQPLYRRVSSRLFNMLAGHLLALPFKDTQCGLKALTHRAASLVFPILSLDGWGYDAELIHVAMGLGLRVEEVDLRLEHDYSDSHFRPLADGWSTFFELFEIRWNDFRGVYRRQPATPQAADTLPPPFPSPMTVIQVPVHEGINRELGERSLEAPIEREELASPSELSRMPQCSQAEL